MWVLIKVLDPAQSFVAAYIRTHGKLKHYFPCWFVLHLHACLKHTKCLGLPSNDEDSSAILRISVVSGDFLLEARSEKADINSSFKPGGWEVAKLWCNFLLCE